jgi:hypothetical protein
LDQDGKRRSKKIGSRSMAQKFARKIEGQLAAGTYQNPARKSWKEFRSDYETKILEFKAPGTRREAKLALDHFEKACRPIFVSTIRTQDIDEFISARRRDSSQRRPGTNVSPATVNKELRHLKADVRVAAEWGFVDKLPRFRMVREPQKLPLYMTPEHLSAIYVGCKVAGKPTGYPFEPTDWWGGGFWRSCT